MENENRCQNNEKLFKKAIAPLNESCPSKSCGWCEKI